MLLLRTFFIFRFTDVFFILTDILFTTLTDIFAYTVTDGFLDSNVPPTDVMVEIPLRMILVLLLRMLIVFTTTDVLKHPYGRFFSFTDTDVIF